MGTLAASAILASSAVAAEYPVTALPQLGRCIKVGKNAGEWKGPHCQNLVPGKGNYKWLEGAAKKGFTSSGEVTEFVTAAGEARTISCAAWHGSGEYTSSKSLKIKILLIGCTLGSTGQRCQTTPTTMREGEIETELEGKLGFIKGAGTSKPVAGWDLTGWSLNVTCGLPPETNITLDKITGSAIATVQRTQSMFSEQKLTFKQKGGKQNPEMFQGEPKDVLTSEFTKGLEKSTEQTGLAAPVVDTNEEPLEIKTRCIEGPSGGGPQCK